MELIWSRLIELLQYARESPMLFNSGLFLGLFTVFLIFYSFLYKRSQLRVIYVIAFSFYFYYKSSGGFLIILLIAIVFNFFWAHYINRFEEKKPRLFLLWLSIAFNCSFLLYFKYTNFFIENLNFFTGENRDYLDIFLPIGISFYTFQTISYVVDVYRRSIKPCANILDFAFYLSFFPQLVAGPIVRAKDFLPQIHQKISFNKEDMGQGLYMILKGLVKKAIIADYVAQYVDLVYANPSGYAGFEHLMAMYAYTLQIYCDFSGYSDMAIGLALLMGFRLPDNFKSPYNAADITEFWRRWHITLSTWLRDYIYIPLGGNRNGEERQFANLMITMLVGGFWHGASWKFVFWGGMHGLGLIVHKIFNQTARSMEWSPEVLKPIGWVINFHFVALLWIFFRAADFGDAALSIHKMIFNLDWAYLIPFLQTRGLVFLFIIVGFALHFVRDVDKLRLAEYYSSLPVLAKAGILLLIVQIILQVQNENVQPFIYFQF